MYCLCSKETAIDTVFVCLQSFSGLPDVDLHNADVACRQRGNKNLLQNRNELTLIYMAFIKDTNMYVSLS